MASGGHCVRVAAGEVLPLVSARGDEVGSFERPGERAHTRSLVVWRSPWSVVPLYPGAETEASLRGNIIDLAARHEAVLDVFLGASYDARLADFFAANAGGREKEELAEELGEKSYYICFNVADFVAGLWTREPFAYFLRLAVAWDDLAKLEGVFRCDADSNAESHAFVIWNDRRTVRYYSGYGGHEFPIYAEFPPRDWFALLRDAVDSRDNGTRWRAIKQAFALPRLFDELHPRDELARLENTVTIAILA
jgi:hypothetical protein